MQRRFRHYDVINAIEQQDTSSTYLVNLSSKPEQHLTLKVFHKPTLLSLATRGKFLQDVKTLNRIRHPQIVSVIEGGIEQGSAYIVSEYMPGGSLRVRLERMSSARLPFSNAITIITQLGQALAYLHAQQIVHGRLRPAHVFFDAHGQTRLAGVYYPEEIWLYDKDTLIYAYKYLSPEQCRDTSGQQIGDALSDQYALCCIAYELFTGQTPFADTNILTLKEKQMNAEPVSLRTLVGDLPPAVDEAILRGLAKDPTQRHADITALLATLQPFMPEVAASATTDEASSVTLAADTKMEDKPEHEKVWDQLIHESETTPMILKSLTASAARTSKHAVSVFNLPTVARTRKTSTTTPTRSRTAPLFAITLLTIVAVSVIMYMLLSTYSPLLSFVQGASTVPQTSTINATDHSGTADAQSTPTTPTVRSATSTVPSTATSTPDAEATPTTVATVQATATPVSPNEPTPTPILSAPPTKPTATPTSVAIRSLYAGQLSAHAKRPGTFATEYVPGLTARDVRIEADITSNGNSGGILFRSGYRLRIGTDGSYDLVTSSRMLATGSSRAIRVGNNVPNHVTIVAKGNTITVSINGQAVVSATDSSYSSGSVGAMAIDFSKSTTTTCNFNIYTA